MLLPYNRMLKAYIMTILIQLLSSQVRAEIFRLLFDETKKTIHLREIARKSALSVGTIQKELANLKELDLVTARRDGNRLYYSANENHPLYQVICELVSKTSGIPETIKEALRTIKGIEHAFIFGSFATGDEKSHSDIDIILIGDVGLRSVTSKLKQISEKIEREINPHTYSSKTWKERIQKNDHFVKSILDSKKIMLIGEEDVIS